MLPNHNSHTFKVGQVWEWSLDNVTLLYQVVSVFYDRADIITLDCNSNFGIVGRSSVICMGDQGLTLAFDTPSHEVSKQACTCDFISVILPYGCKCGGK